MRLRAQLLAYASRIKYRLKWDPTHFIRLRRNRGILRSKVRTAVPSLQTDGYVFGKIFCDFAIPKLHRCVSFKDYGNRYYPLSFYIKTFYGKEFDIGISIVAEEYHDDCFAIVRDGEERPAIATTWIEPVGVCIRDVIKRKCEGWELTNENIEKRAM